MNKKIVFAALIASMAALPLVASAGTQSAPLSVTATVVNDCSISVPSPWNLTSSYDFLNAADVNVTENGTVNCTTGSSPSITLASANPGLNDGKGDNLMSTLSASAVSAGGFTLTEDIGAGQNVPAGSYSGSDTVTVNF